MRGSRLLLLLAIVLVSSVAIMTKTGVARAYSEAPCNCDYGQGVRAGGTMGPGGLTVTVTGYTLNGQVVKAQGGTYCGYTSCNWTSSAGGIYSVAWSYLETVDDSFSDILYVYCFASAGSTVQGGTTTQGGTATNLRTVTVSVQPAPGARPVH